MNVIFFLYWSLLEVKKWLLLFFLSSFNQENDQRSEWGNTELLQYPNVINEFTAPKT